MSILPCLSNYIYIAPHICFHYPQHTSHIMLLSTSSCIYVSAVKKLPHIRHWPHPQTSKSLYLSLIPVIMCLCHCCHNIPESPLHYLFAILIVLWFQNVCINGPVSLSYILCCQFYHITYQPQMSSSHFIFSAIIIVPHLQHNHHLTL